jgi:DNA-binding response OmpR family regulator
MTRLLMIDDDEKLVALVREYLEPQGFTLSAAHDGETGIAAALAASSLAAAALAAVAAPAEAPELVILDLMLPRVDGLEVCRRIRAHSAIPILMLTARGDDTDRIVGLEMGADDYLPKPFNPRELLARVRAILRRSGEREAVTAANIEVGALSVCPASRSVRLSGRVVDLTSAEFDLLHALAANAGRVLSRDRLLEQVHGAGWAAYDRSVDVHVSRIRQKLGDDPKRPRWLKTVRGAGYLLAREPEP